MLNTSKDERDPYDSEELKSFPYVNGGLFAEEITIPQFTEELAELLIKASENTNWKGISPTIFGATFESTLNPETRRSGGMHYTSIENIHKVIDPLFLDDLKKELSHIEAISTKADRIREREKFCKKLSKLTFLDPACGSGNFLTETYLCLRKLENQILLTSVREDEKYTDDYSAFISNDKTWFYNIYVNINQFYGIEINDFAVAVAKTALWIAEAQAKAETEELLGEDLHILPLAKNDNIVVANALRMDWNTLIPNTQLSYIIGNPPFSGKKERGITQTEDIELCYGQGQAKELDYVACWFKVATEYMKNSRTKAALVATKSITQGEQAFIWTQMLKTGVRIDFAWRPFMWDSDSLSPAHVVCVIIGFSVLIERERTPRIFTVLPKNTGIRVEKVKWISPYLEEYPLLVIDSHSEPICKQAPKIIYGNMPIPANPFIFKDEEEVRQFIKKDKVNSLFIKPYVGGDEFVKNKQRWCLWLHNEDKSVWQQSNSILERIRQCYDFRINSSRPATRKLASTPELFGEIRQPNKMVLLIPKVTGCERDYIPIAYVTPDNIINGSAMYVDESTLYHFGILTSIVHNAWMRAIAGRTGTSYQYSIDIVYNSFPWPEPSEGQIKEIEAISSKILDIRNSYSSKSLAYLYNKAKMPPDLFEVHKSLDRKVLSLYGLNGNCGERKIVCKLFEMYAGITGKEIITTTEQKDRSILS